MPQFRLIIGLFFWFRCCWRNAFDRCLRDNRLNFEIYWVFCLLNNILFITRYANRAINSLTLIVYDDFCLKLYILYFILLLFYLSPSLSVFPCGVVGHSHTRSLQLKFFFLFISVDFRHEDKCKYRLGVAGWCVAHTIQFDVMLMAMETRNKYV